jgi:hypothetical protein
LATAGIASSKTVTPSATTPSASPSAPRCSLRGAFEGDSANEDKGDAAEEDKGDAADEYEEFCDW